MSEYWPVFYEGSHLRDIDPQASVSKMTQASQLAKEAGDANAALFMDHWVIQTLMYKLEDYGQAYEIAVRAVVDARKPVHKEQMERICVHEDLIGVYMGIDPLGNASLIEQALAYMTEEITPDLDCKHCLMGIVVDFDLVCGRLDKAYSGTQRHLAETENSEHHHGLAYLTLCEILYERRDWEKILENADRGLRYLAMVRSNARYEAAILAGRALALRKLGRDAEASTTYRLATSKGNRIAGNLTRSYYDFLCDYWLAEGNLQAALGLRDRQLAGLEGKGQAYWEAMCRLQRMRLLKKLQQPFDGEIELVRALAAKLRDSETILKPLAEITG